ncbi:MAG: hypothetical protein JO290_08330 [Sphingomonadaceae bacterium]|nr:hypothetical protein [Sphingomonadaceae bacterium]
MVRILTATAALLALAAPAVAARLTGEEEIAKALAGRTAGKPTDCLYEHDIDATTIVDHTAILYRMRDGTIYLNRPRSGAEALRSEYALLTRTETDQLCTVDIVRLLDPVDHFETGFVGLGPFIPYPRPPKP